MERTDYQKNLIAKTDPELFKKYEDFINGLSKEKLENFRSELHKMITKIQTERAITSPELFEEWGFNMNIVTWLLYFNFWAHFHEDKSYIINYDSSNYKVPTVKCYFTMENLWSDLDRLIKEKQ